MEGINVMNDSVPGQFVIQADLPDGPDDSAGTPEISVRSSSASSGIVVFWGRAVRVGCFLRSQNTQRT